MAVVSTISDNTISYKLMIGTSATGAVKTATINLAGVKKTAFDAQDPTRAYTIGGALSPCLNYSLYQVIHTQRNFLSEE